MALSVPTPYFRLFMPPSSAPATQFTPTDPISLWCNPVTFPDGTKLSLENATQFGYLFYRQSPPAPAEVWDDRGQAWVDSFAPLVPQSLPPVVPVDGSWQTVFVAAGDPKKFMPPTAAGMPQYYAQCFFRGIDAGGVEHSGISALSTQMKIFPAGALDLAGLDMLPHPPKPQNATAITLFLRDSPAASPQTVSIEKGPSGITIELAANAAKLTLTESGAIVLAPAAGQAASVQGSLVVQGNLTLGGNLDLAATSHITRGGLILI